MNGKLEGRLRRLKPQGIRSTIMIVFSTITIIMMLVLGVVMYLRFSSLLREEMLQNTQKLTSQMGETLEDYLISMRQVSDTAYYNVIKENDFSAELQTIQSGMNLLYEANGDNLQSIAVFDQYGSLLAAEPVDIQKEDPDVTHQGWFVQAQSEVENMHFSTPHIQNLFDDSTHRYYWVLSLSRAVEITRNGKTNMGVLLVDMDFSAISRMMEQINDEGNGQYYYLCDSSGEIIYHPRQEQISRGICEENSAEIAAYKEGVYEDHFGGTHRTVVVNTISYTGWKLVGVIPDSAYAQSVSGIQYFAVVVMLLMVMMLVIVYRVVSDWIARPILRLEGSVREYEAGEKPQIDIGGSEEIRHLGTSIQKSYEQIEELMKRIVREHNERRKSELDALQSQINPHFLYNALESITWMIEDERNDEAVFMVAQLSRLFRISLSKGRTIIRIEDELRHAESYMNIQKIRYKDQFEITYDVDPVVNDYCIVKLVLQPILENAINYGVGGMEDDGEIRVRGWLEEKRIYLSVTDNGMGMTRETVDALLTDRQRVHEHGSGVGLMNVNTRLQIFFGAEYGLHIESEPDEGTTVTICVPAIPYSEENRERLENSEDTENA